MMDWIYLRIAIFIIPHDADTMYLADKRNNTTFMTVISVILDV